MKESMLVMVKPDAVMDKRDQEIRAFLVSCGMSITKEQKVWLTDETLRALYDVDRMEKDVFKEMVKLFKESFAVVIFFEGDGAVEIGHRTRKVFREKYNYGYYGTTIHAADNAEEAAREAVVLMGS